MKLHDPENNEITCEGFIFLDKEHTPDPWDYFDLKHKIWSKEELKKDLRHKVLPIGMILKIGDTPPVVVTKIPGGLGTIHTIRPIAEFLGIGTINRKGNLYRETISKVIN